MTKTPTEIKRSENEVVEISWSDTSNSHISNKTLRTNCPCALCREQRKDKEQEEPKPRSALRIIEHTEDEATTIEKIWPVGNYAIGIRWKDGHSTGIYSFALLEELSLS